MKRAIQLLLGLAVSGAFLWFSFSRADFSRLGETMRSINLWYTIPFVAVTMLTMWVRAIRWHYLLVPARDIPTRRLFPPLMIGFALNGVFPARAGEFGRAWLVSRSDKIPFSAAFATVFVERLYDSILLVLVILGVFTFYDFTAVAGQPFDSRWEMSPEMLAWAALAGIALAVALAFCVAVFGTTVGGAGRRRALWAAAVAALLGAGGAWLAVLQTSQLTAPVQFGSVTVIDAPMLTSLSNKLVIIFAILLAGSLAFIIRPVRAFAERLLRALPLPAHFKEKLVGILHAFGQGFDSLASPRLIAGVLGSTIALWLLVAWSMQILAFAFPGLGPMSIMDGLAITMLICLAIIIPAAPGYWGLYEVGCVVAMHLLGITDDYEVALGYSLVAHALQMIPIIAVGAWYAVKANLKPAQLIHAAEESAGTALAADAQPEETA